MRASSTFILLALTACFIPAGTRAELKEAPASGNDEVVIISVSPDPLAPSGVVAFVVEMSGNMQGIETEYFIPFMEIGQPKPRVGQKCSIRWQWQDAFDMITGNGRSVREGRWVTEFSCDGETSHIL